MTSLVSATWQVADTTRDGNDAPIHGNHDEYTRFTGSGNNTQYVAVPTMSEIIALGFTPAQKW